jgi:hypothetical protein
MSHNPGYRILPLSSEKEGESNWSDHGVDLAQPTTASGRLRAVAQEVAILEEQLQLAAALLKRVREVAEDPQFSDEFDEEIVTFINKHAAKTSVSGH